MAEKTTYPQIPSTVWWGVRSALQRSPNATIDDRFLGTQLNVQDAAARQYIAELKRTGILSEDGKATAIAHKWRHDESYWEAAQEILQNSYPQSLIDVAPPGDADRPKIVSWFTRDGLGTGSAANKAATYLMIGSRQPNDAPGRNAPEKKVPVTKKESAKPNIKSFSPTSPKDDQSSRRLDSIPLNINVQIHISADATADQIDAIFGAMRRYLYEQPTS